MIIVDSNVIIYLARSDTDSLKKTLSKMQLCVSAVSKIEVLGYSKLTDDDRTVFETFFAAAPIFPISDDIIDHATALRQKRKMSVGDAIIAATALLNKLKLATSNTKDFKWIDSLDIFDPMENL